MKKQKPKGFFKVKQWWEEHWQHSVNYKPFFKRNKLKLKEGLKISKGINNYGMKLIELEKENK